MKRRLIMSYSLEIVLCVAIILFSVMFWKNIDMSYYNSIAKEYENYPIINQG